MHKNPTHIAVLLTCYNRKKKTLSCLDDLFKCILPEAYKLSVFLVDDSSTDGTAEAVKQQFPRVQLIYGNGSLYWNRGMHLAWQKAKEKADFDYYLWLNDDTDLMPDALIEMLECAALQQNSAIICGAICSRITHSFSYGGRDADGKEVLPDNDMPECNVINGNCVLVSREICNRVGMLDPVYPHAIGDHEYGLRAAKNGFTSVTTRKFIGYCERNDALPAWCYSKVPLKKRISALYSPLGNSHPYYFFLFERKYYGLPKAVKHYLTIHLRLLLPSLWK
ncbi:MAG: glycosyltransferase family 2 protein [Sphingobacteriales bacterium]|nr:glycosyltransferase family 2 protein [Sphingobacteriales bacterium]OJY81135.1 MAG: hypothetical protein BGP14_07935 [Sphingobacteriales bacterium 44-15]